MQEEQQHITSLLKQEEEKRKSDHENWQETQNQYVMELEDLIKVKTELESEL